MQCKVDQTPTYLLSFEFYLEILGRLLGDPPSEIQLVHLRVLVPQGRLVVHQELLVPRGGRGLCRPPKGHASPPTPCAQNTVLPTSRSSQLKMKSVQIIRKIGARQISLITLQASYPPTRQHCCQKLGNLQFHISPLRSVTPLPIVIYFLSSLEIL